MAAAPVPRGFSPELELLGAALVEAVVARARGGASCTVLFSGGLDSSLLAHLLPKPPDPRLVTVGVAGAPDLAAARAGALELGLLHEVREVSRESVLRRARDPSVVPEGLREPLRSVRVSLALALEATTPGGTVLLGQGADELFFGYRHYRGLSPSAARARAEADLARLREVEWPWTVAWASRAGVRVEAPYLDDAVVELARRLRVPDLAGGERPKEALRRVARSLGLPQALVDRPKRAFQYGSRVASVLEGPGPGPA